MIIETKYSKGDWVWFMSYRLKKPIQAQVTAIEVNVKDEVFIRYQISPDGKKSYFYEWQLFEKMEEVLSAI